MNIKSKSKRVKISEKNALDLKITTWGMVIDVQTRK
jgi:hypothetical protein